MEYTYLFARIEKFLSLNKYAILATASKDGIVSASKMCMVFIDSKIYFQTCKTFEKVRNIEENPHVAITINNVYFKGQAKIIGSANSNSIFVKKIAEMHPEAYSNYTNLDNQVLIEIELTECRIWGYWPQEQNETKKEEAIKVLNLTNKSINSIKCENLNIN